MFTELRPRHFVVILMSECYFLNVTFYLSAVYNLPQYNSAAGKTQLESLPSIEELKKFM